MKFKILKGTPLFDKLIDVKTKIRDCNAAAFALVKEMGYERMRGKEMVLAGGISSIEIKGGKPDGWRVAFAEKTKDEYFPSKLKQNKEILSKISALPVVGYEELNDILDYDFHKHEGKRLSFHPAVIWKEDFILVSVAEYMYYQPAKDMVEILESEYMKLSNQ